MKPAKQENQAYLKEQILTYLGNKRSLLGFIERGVKYAKDELKKEKLSCCDLFSGSGVVARFLKQNSEFLVANEFFIAPLLYNASVHANTSGIFKGFHKNKEGIGQFGGQGQNAISRITSDINLTKPIFSNFSVPFEIYQKDANLLAKELDGLDLVYLDPPYNQHPYGSNYFMLNLIASYTEPSKISKVSGISKDWNRSVFNKKSSASEAFFGLIANLKAKFVLISFNSEGFINQDEFDKNLKKMGKVHLLRQKYNAYRGSRNLKARNIHVDELLYVLKK